MNALAVVNPEPGEDAGRRLVGDVFGAEVVERGPASQLAELAGELGSAGDVGDGGGFRALDRRRAGLELSDRHRQITRLYRPVNRRA
jgi:hypothetical protein